MNLRERWCLGLILVAVVALAGCASTDSGEPSTDPDRRDLYLAVAVETAVGTLISLQQTDTLPEQGVAFVDATIDYGATACAILGDSELTPDQRRLHLTTGLAEERAVFDEAFAELADSRIDRDTLRIITPLVHGARAAIRVALTERIDPALYERPCASVAQLKTMWAMAQSGVPVPAMSPIKPGA